MSRASAASQVLRLLLESRGPRSGEEMGRMLGCSRAAVGKAVGGLRDMGFDIQAKPKLGYVLVSEPDEVLPARMEARLGQGAFGLPFVHFNEIDSTNLEARRRAEQGLGHGACVLAEKQSAGRGRLDRRWQAPRGSCLLFSLVLRPRLELGMVFSLTNLAAVALCRVLERAHGLSPKIKWPNDVYLDGRKLAGILTEFTCRAESLEFAVVGVGLNVNLTQGQLGKLPAPASSLRRALGEKVDRAGLLAAILAEAGSLYESVEARDWRALTDEYSRLALLTNRRVTVSDGGKVITGLAKGVEADGALILETEPGKAVRVRHGDVTVLAMEG